MTHPRICHNDWLDIATEETRTGGAMVWLKHENQPRDTVVFLAGHLDAPEALAAGGMRAAKRQTDAFGQRANGLPMKEYRW